MPMFDFVCKSCGHEIEDKYTSRSNTVVACPQCGAEMSKKVSAPSNFECKGTMWQGKAGANFRTSEKHQSTKGQINV